MPFLTVYQNLQDLDLVKRASSIASRTSTTDQQPQLNPRNVLPKKLQIKLAGHHLYLHGIMFHRLEGESHEEQQHVRHQDSNRLIGEPKTTTIRRSLFYNPYLIFTLEVIYLVRSAASIFVSDRHENRQYFVKAGDYMYFINAKTHINIAAVQEMVIGLIILSFNYIQHRRKIYPKFLDLYKVLNGTATPASIGIRNPQNIRILARKSKLAFTLNYNNTLLVMFVSFLLSAVPTVGQFTLQENILYGIPWSVTFALASYHAFSSYAWILTYFYVLCHLVKFRLLEMNDLMERMLNRLKKDSAPAGLLRQRQFSKMIDHLERQYSHIEREVRHYNRNYWSFYLFFAIGSLATFNNVILFTALFVNLDLVMRTSLLYAVVVSVSAIFFILQTASLVYQQSDRSRLILASFYVTASKARLNRRSQFKLSRLIEGRTAKRIGFHFLNLFIINYSRFFQISALIIAYFLKVVELSVRS